MNETCGCCEGIEQLTPLTIVNRPGLDALIYRVGTHASFLETMLARLSNLGIARKDLDMPLSEFDDPDALIYPVRGLTTREASDAAIAFLDSWATVADVLIFYQERIANEGYLRTATERRSILELARLVGYMLRPGVAASVFLAYTLEKDNNVTILPGNRAQSIPGPGELPQSFETADPLEARFIWNTLQPRLTRPQFISLIPGFPLSSPPSPPTGEEDTINTDTLYFQGTATKLKSGDPLLFIFKDSLPDTSSFFGEPFYEFVFVRVATVTPQAKENRTLVTVDRNLSQSPVSSLPVSGEKLSYIDLVKNLTATPSVPPRNSQQLERQTGQIFNPQSGINSQILKNINPALGETLDAALSNATVTTTPSIPLLDCAAALRVKAALFGQDVPIQLFTRQFGLGALTVSTQGRGDLASLLPYLLPLDAQYDIAPGSWVVIETESIVMGETTTLTTRTFRKVVKVQTITLSPLDALEALGSTVRVASTGRAAAATLPPALAALAIAKKITLLTLDKPWLENPPKNESELLLLLRGTTIYAQSECLTLAEEPFVNSPAAQQSGAGGSTSGTDACVVQGDTIELDQLYPDLQSGRWAIVSGERADVAGTSGVMVGELVLLAGVTQDVGTVTVNIGGVDTTIPLPGDKLHTFLKLAKPLSFQYKCDTVTIYGNVVRATHGETRSEVLGSGDGSKALQRFTLSQSPLTYIAAPTAAGAESTVQVRVNDILWHEADSLVDLGPKDRSYTTETDDADKTTVIFGNGQYGERLPTGVENVKAVYRIGIGKPGNVQAGQISLLTTKPLGVKSVINPLRASGGADRESQNSARSNVPLALLALDRLVSVEDYEDFARTYAGIGKASAANISDGRRQLVHLSIAGADNIPIDVTSDLHLNLVQALQQLGDPNVPLQVAICEVMFIVISASVRLLPDYLWEAVESQIRAALLDTFSFERRNLGQPVFESEVFSAIQGVTGVDYVDLQILGAVDQASVVNALDIVSQTPPDPSDPKETATQEFLELLDLTGHKNIPVHLAMFNPTTNQIDPAQLAFLSPDVPDTLILTELTQ